MDEMKDIRHAVIANCLNMVSKEPLGEVHIDNMVN